MDPHLLRTFVAVAGCGSFSAAAAQLGYTQSAVSQQIAALEADLGTPLLRRRPVTVTEAGERLLEHATPILLRLDAARAEVMRAAAPPPAQLTMAMTPLAAAPAVAAALARIRQEHPRLAVTLRTAGRADLPAGVATGRLDLALVDGAAAPGDPLRLPDLGAVTAKRIAQAELAVVLPSGHPLAGRASLRLTDLADARWLDAPDTAVPLADLRAATGTDGFRPALRYEGTDLPTLVTLAAAQQGLTVLPRPVLTGLRGVAAVAVSWPPLVHRTELLHSTVTGAAAALTAALSGLYRGGPLTAWRPCAPAAPLHAGRPLTETACGAVFLRRHYPDQVLGVALRASQPPASPEVRPSGRTANPAPPPTSQVNFSIAGRPADPQGRKSLGGRCFVPCAGRRPGVRWPQGLPTEGDTDGQDACPPSIGPVPGRAGMAGRAMVAAGAFHLRPDFPGGGLRRGRPLLHPCRAAGR